MNSQSVPLGDFSFGATVVAPGRRELLHNGKKVEVGDRAFDLLLFLVNSRGDVASKDAIISHVWPRRIVEENTVEGQISALRRALGCDRTAIRTVTGRGYQFTGELAGSQAAELRPEPVASAGVSVPAEIAPILGRADALDDICHAALQRRLITLSGTGGIGKTRLALEAARQLTPNFPGGVYLAELASTTSADFLPSTIAVALGFPPGDGTPSLDRLAPALSAKRLLLILDNCEHLIEDAAQICERLLCIAPGATVLATSREPLRISGEYVYRVPSLSVPPDEAVSDAREFGAVQLFEERSGNLGAAARSCNQSALSATIRICRQLDGIPLAIELAAACSMSMPLEEIADRLDDRFQLLTRGSRTALPRQQTLRATLDWSYALLSAVQRTILNRLSLFAGAFSAESAQAFAATGDIPADTVFTALFELVDKSLISVIPTEGKARFRLLETTRAYAREKLRAEGAWAEWRGRHASYLLRIFKEAEQQASARVDVDWNSRYAPHLEDLRAAVEWSFSAEGDPHLAVDLTIAGIPLSMQLALLEECLARVDRSLQWLSDTGDSTGEREMKLFAARGMCLLCYAVGARTSDAFDKVIEIAAKIGNDAYQLLGIWGRWMCYYLNGQYSDMPALAVTFEDVAARSEWACDKLASYRVSGISRLLMGELDTALVKLDRAANSFVQLPRAQRMRFLYDERMLSHTSLAHALWFKGYVDQARTAALQSLDDAREFDHPVSICYALSEAVCTLAILIGDDLMLKEAADELALQTRRHSIATWRARAEMWHGLIELRAGNSSAYSQTIYPAMTRIGSKRFYVSLTPFLTATVEALASYGKHAQALELITPSVERAVDIKDECSLAELTRAKAQLLWTSQGPEANAAVESLFKEALANATRIGFLSWQLRCATSLASFQKSQGDTHSAQRLVAPLYARFSEGLDTRDLKAAHALMLAS
ncbi:ATP-binding protein [Paraburkholderia sp. GAS199]|uniref:ATP-binding protein n=1 Tax=Paraburkholderia sp. GAS199 TaxID=3035126 RepID=UPI003D1B0302